MTQQTNGAAAPTTTKPTYALATRTEFAPVVFTPQSLPELYQHAQKLAASGLIPSALRGKADDVAIVLMTGLELGLSPMQSLRGIHVIEGRPTLASELIVARIMADPSCEYLTLVDSTDKRATYKAKRRGAPSETSLTWTIEMAARANLLGKQNWKANPEAMLRARCAAAICRVVWPDKMLGIDAREEREEIDVTPAPAAEPPKARKPKSEPLAPVVVLQPAPVVETSARESTPVPQQEPEAVAAEVVEEHDAGGEVAISEAAAALLTKVAAATKGADLDAIAKETNAAKRAGVVTLGEYETIKIAVQSKRAELEAA